MESSQDRLKADLILLNRALKTLEEVLNMPRSNVTRDAAIQRFEYCFELSWKALQAASRISGLDCASPRDAIKNGFKEGWITDAKPWFESLEARNLTSHTYNEKLAETVYQIAKRFPEIAESLRERLVKSEA